MKYLSIDVETSGVNHNENQILSIGVVIEDTKVKAPLLELPKLEIGILHKKIVGDLFALNMNSQLISDLSTYNQLKTDQERFYFQDATKREYMKDVDVSSRIYDFLYEFKYIDSEIYNNRKKVKLNVAGKNFASFDKLFIELLPNWNDLFRIPVRILDPAILFIDWEKDEIMPDLSTCKERAGIDKYVTHNAVDDALDVIKLLRTRY